MKSRITIITPNLNQVRYLEQTIDSVLSQGFSNLEYIIIDGGSTDGSVDIIKKYKKHLAYWVSEPDNGQSQAINKGVKRASGEIINWLNSDDYLEDGALTYIADIFSNPDVNALCAKANHIKYGHVIQTSTGTNVYPDNLDKTIGWARFDQPETWFRKHAWDTVGELNTGLHYLMDREWWIRYLFHFGQDGIVASDRIIVNFRLHDTSKSVSQSEKFQHDHDSIFYGMALQMKFTSVANLIQSHCTINDDYSFPIEMGQKQGKNVLNYYLLHRAHEFYYQKNRNKCTHFLSMVSKNDLDKPCQKLYKKISFRNRINPVNYFHAIKG